MTTEKGIQELDSFLQTRSYIDGWYFSSADIECFEKIPVSPDAQKSPNAFRWYMHIASLRLQGIQSIPATPAASPLRKKMEDIFADHRGIDLPRESRSEMMARIKRDVRESMAKTKIYDC